MKTNNEWKTFSSSPHAYLMGCTFICRRPVWSTCMVRVEQVDEPSSLLSPAGWALPHHHGFFLSLWEHRVAPLKPHLGQEEIDTEGPRQEAQAEGPSGAGVLHGDTVSSVMTSQLQRVYMGTGHMRIDLMPWQNQNVVCKFLSSANDHWHFWHRLCELCRILVPNPFNLNVGTN